MSTSGLAVIADDLTGAADSAAAHGPFTEVAVVLDASAGLPAAEVVAIDTDSRHRGPEFAARAVRDAVRAAAGTGRAVYKKIDSTLRGHVATEVVAALDALEERSAGALVAPAFPATGRTVSGGVLHVGGVPRHDGDLLALFAGVRTALLTLDVVRSGTQAVVRAYDAHRAEGVRVVCADAETDEDLRVLDAALAQLGPRVLPVGSAGLARAAVGARSAQPRRDDEEPAAGRVLTVLGSYSAPGLGQRKVIAASPEVTTVAIAAPFGPAQQREAAAALRAAGGDLLLVPDPDAPVHRSHAAEVAAALSEVTAGYLRAHADLGGVILAGGETARAVLLSAGAKGFTVLGELEPGVVRSRIPALGGITLVTKAGAFGEPSTVERARRSLHESTVSAVR